MERVTRAAAVLGIRIPRRNGWSRHFLMWFFALSISLVPAPTVIAAGTLTNASVALSDSRPNGSGISYTFTGSSVDAVASVRCVKVIWSTTSTGDTAPTGFSGAAGAVNAPASTLINSSATNWSLAKSDGTSSAGQNNIYQYTNSAVGVTPSTTTGATFQLTGITNSSLADTAYYFKLFTYTNTNCSAGAVDNASVQFINTNGSTLSLTVDATLSFTVAGTNNGSSCNGATTTGTATATTLPFGNVTTAANAVLCQDLSVATNATNGYTVFMRYTGEPNNGVGDDIDDHGGTNAAPTTFSNPGVEAYGYTTDDSSLGTGTTNRFTAGGQKWAAADITNAEVGYSPTGTTTTHFFIGHQVGIGTGTASGSYQTTIIYTCTPVY